MDVISSTENGVTTITLDRHHHRNAVNPPMAQALFDTFLRFEADDTAKVAVLAGAGTAFCAGFDLKAAAAGEAESWLEQVDIPEGWTDPVAQPIPGPMGPTRLMLSKPVIAAIEGPAVAGGVELAAWCDMRVMGEGASIGVYCRRWGVPLIDGGTVRLPRIMGQGRDSLEHAWGKVVLFTMALKMGFANRVTPLGKARDVAQGIAHELTRFPQACMRADHLSSRMSPADLAVGLRREWQSASAFVTEGRTGAARFAAGHGRGGDFTDI